jgi:hypothetical protein
MKSAEQYVNAAEEHMALAAEFIKRYHGNGAPPPVQAQHHREMAALNLTLARIAEGL